jgi:hypothetical protein
MSVDDARRELSRTKDLAAVVNAAESGDAIMLLDLAVKVDGVCQMGRVLPEGCESRDSIVEGVHQDCGERCVRPLSVMEDWLSATLVNGPVKLEFAARDSRLPAGEGGLYFLTFRAAKPGTLEDYDGIGLVVRPGRQNPIEDFSFMQGAEQGLAFAQYKVAASNQNARAEESYQSLVLIAPKTVATWRDIDHQTAEITVVMPGYVTPVPPAGQPGGTYPSGTMSGITEVDSFLTKAYAGDLSSLAPRAVFQPQRCGESIDLPSCDSGDLLNTPYDVLGVYNCDKHFARSVAELETALNTIDKEGPQYLLLILAPRNQPSFVAEARAYYIVGMRTASYPGRTFYLDQEGRLLLIDSCAESRPIWRMEVPAEQVLLPPP